MSKNTRLSWAEKPSGRGVVSMTYLVGMAEHCCEGQHSMPAAHEHTPLRAVGSGMQPCSEGRQEAERQVRAAGAAQDADALPGGGRQGRRGIESRAALLLQLRKPADSGRGTLQLRVQCTHPSERRAGMRLIPTCHHPRSSLFGGWVSQAGRPPAPVQPARQPAA